MNLINSGSRLMTAFALAVSLAACASGRDAEPASIQPFTNDVDELVSAAAENAPEMRNEAIISVPEKPVKPEVSNESLPVPPIVPRSKPEISAPPTNSVEVALKPGDAMPDGSTYVGTIPETGQAFYAAVYDLRGRHSWNEAKALCENLDYHGHADWKLPSEAQSDVIYQNHEKGALAGTFYQNMSWDDPGFYWLAEESSDGGYAMIHRYSNDDKAWALKEVPHRSRHNTQARVRCVRID